MLNRSSNGSNCIMLMLLWLFGKASAACRLLGDSGRPLMDCARVGLTVIPRPPAGTMALKMSRNPLGFLGRNVFHENDAGNLVELWLAHCDLHEIAPGAFFAMENLKMLDLSWNYLVSLEAGHFVSLLRLERLVLRNNRLVTVPDFRSLIRLRHLDISFNQIANITLPHLRLSALEMLDISNNALETAPPLLELNGLKMLMLDGNPWRCDCHLRHLVEWQRERRSAIAPFCHQPDNVANLTWNQLAITEFACGPHFLNASFNDHEPIHIVDGQNLALVCAVTGDPRPVVLWRVGAKRQLLPDTLRIFSNPVIEGRDTIRLSLTIREFTAQDPTEFWCLASTGRNQAARKFQVIYSKYAKSIENGYLIIIALSSVLFLLTCCAIGVAIICRKGKLKKLVPRKNMLKSRHPLLTDTNSRTKIAEIYYQERQIEPIYQRIEENRIIRHSRSNGAPAQHDCHLQQPPDLESTDRRGYFEIVQRKAPLAQPDRETPVMPILETRI